MFCSKCGASISETVRFCSQCGTPTSEENPSQLKGAHEIKEVHLDFKQVIGRYPILFETTYHDMKRQRSYRWEPQDFTMDRVKEAVLNEVNKYMLEGWELLEDDLNKVLITQHEWVEKGLLDQVMSSLPIINLFTTEYHINKYTYIGARFHVRR